MPKIQLVWKFAQDTNILQRACYATFNRSKLPTVDTVNASYNTLNVDEFRRSAFVPETPLLITERDAVGNKVGDGISISRGLPAADKWFSLPREGNGALVLSKEYLSKFGHTILPYELILDFTENNAFDWVKQKGEKEEYTSLWRSLEQVSTNNSDTFHHLHAPLSLFLQACKPEQKPPPLRRLYIAQAQISDLPTELQDDLPTPQLVLEAGKGDIYDANIWLGIPPTYTPLHKDPNPNLFIQLANSKRVRIFPPRVGSSIFQQVQQRIGESSNGIIRGSEMMEGPEREALDEAVWGDAAPVEGFEVVVHSGDALFIPKGWWHSFKSIGEGVNGSVNWWFR